MIDGNGLEITDVFDISIDIMDTINICVYLLMSSTTDLQKKKGKKNKKCKPTSCSLNSNVTVCFICLICNFPIRISLILILTAIEVKMMTYFTVAVLFICTRTSCFRNPKRRRIPESEWIFIMIHFQGLSDQFLKFSSATFFFFFLVQSI